MTFLAPWLLYGLGALSLPILIHLWHRRRVVEVPFSTLRFLKAIAARTSRSSKIENLLLLLLRCLLFLLVILAAARPVMLARTAQIFGGEVPRTVVLVIDNSMSMGYLAGGQTRLDTAKTCALAVFNDLKQGDRVAVIAAGDRADLLVAEPTIDRAVARKALESIRLTPTRSDWAVALREAGKIAARAERGIRQVFVFTDNQETGWRSTIANPAAVFDTAWKQAEPQLVVVRPDALGAPNACVKAIRLQSPTLVPGSTVRGVATVENFGSTTLHDLVSISIGAERVAQRTADVPPGAAVEVGFEFQAPFVTGRWARGTASLSGDNLAADDTYYFTLPVYQSPRVLVAEGASIGPERLRPGFFLRKALAAGAESAIQVRAIAASQLDETAIENETAVFLADPGKLSDRSVARLERFLDGGATVVLFPGDQTRLGDYSNATFLPGQPTASRNLAAGRQPVRIADATHPLFADAWDTGTPFPALPQQRLFDWKLSAAAQTLLTLGSANDSAGGLPFLIYGERGPGRIVIVNASADRTWGDFPLSPAFVPLVQQIARFSAAQGGKPLRLSVGDPVPLPPALPRDKTVVITQPDGSKRSRVLNTGADARTMLLDRAEQTGFYQASAGEETLVFAVNTDRSESNLRPLDTATFDKLAAGTQLVGHEALTQWLARSKGLVPVWPLLLIAALLVFAAEGILANLMARRRAQGDGQQILTGRLNRRRMGVPFYGANQESAP
ncbi:MAG: BatA and WFA domain-containing protein [Verrucomicrobiota bacterium]